MLNYSSKSIARTYIGNWSDYEEMMSDKFGKDLQPHRVEYKTLKSQFMQGYGVVVSL